MWNCHMCLYEIAAFVEHMHRVEVERNGYYVHSALFHILSPSELQVSL